ncbi:MAG: carbohydrate ABC transporter permease [Eubacteriales bacterium]|nr:carbohydrate ABC transporter permease [Eubacteriales bacterium]
MTANAISRTNHKKIQPGRVMLYVVLLLGVVVTLFPFIWMVLCSFKSNVEVIQIPPSFLPKQWVADGYIRAWERDIVTPYLNTIIVAVSITFFQLATASMAAYAFARLRFPGRNVLFLVVLSMMMVPQNMTMIPKFHIVRALGGYDKLIGIIMPNFISINVTFFIRQNFLSFPSELEDAAKIDGCSHLRIFLRILLPLSTSILTAMGIMVLLWAWNDLLWPTIIVTKETNRTLSMFIALCKGQYVTDYGFLMAASSLAIIPMIIVYGIFQKAFVSSITMSGIKG